MKWGRAALRDCARRTGGSRTATASAAAASLSKLAAGVLTVLLSAAYLASPVCAGDDHDDHDDYKRQFEEQQKRADEDARRMQEQQQQAAEQQRQAADRQRQAAEQQRQAAEQQRNSSSRSSSSAGQQQGPFQRQPDDDGDQASSGSGGRSSGSRDNDSGRSGSSSSSNSNGSKTGKDKESADGDGDNSSRHHDRRQAQDDSTPPATVEKWLKQITTPKQADGDTGSGKGNWAAETKPEVDKTSPGKPELNGKPQAPGTTAASAKPNTTKQPASSGGLAPPVALPDLATPDILAVNASKATLDRAIALGFKARPQSKFSNLDMAVTALVPPPGMSPAAAKALLVADMPAANFASNKKYRIYRTASGTDAGDTVVQPATLHKPGSPTDCSGDHCFGRDVIGWKPELRSCVNGVRVGIIDTSVDVTHPAFTGKKLEVHHFGADGAPPGPDWHGTGVTALLAGDAASGTPGMIPDANFFIADIFHADSDHEPASDTVSMLRAFDWLDAKGVKIVNMSLSGPPDDVLKAAIEKLAAKGVLFVAAAGNEGPKAPPSYPAAYDQVIAVTAVTKDLQSYRYANRGSYIDVAAPGVAIWTALPGSKEGYHSGTSFATPYVTAALAAIYPRMHAKTQAEALQLIEYKDLGAPGRDPIYGQGLLVAPSTCSGGQIAANPGAFAPAAHAGGPVAPPVSAKPATPAAPVAASTVPSLGFRPSGN